MGGDPFTEAQESFRRIHTGAISSSSTSTSTAIPVPGSAPAIRPAGPAPGPSCWSRAAGGKGEGGRRFLVDRLWPRGIKRERLSLDAWAKEVAPSDTLRRWFAHDPYRWDEFRRRYAAELDRRPDAVGKTVIIERKHVGGTCINVGCTPTKTMVASARVAYLAQRAADYGVHLNGVRVSMAEVRRRKQGIVESFRNGRPRHLPNTKNLELIFGEASFSGPKSVAVRLQGGEPRHLTADTIFINTGGRPEGPPLPGLDSVPVLDSTSLMGLDG